MEILLSARHLYVHVPFCAHRCGYCDFVTLVGRRGEHGRYVDALLRELELESGLLAGRLETVYLGGGTPTFTEPDDLLHLLAGLPGAEELTVEANPETVTPALAALLREGGVTRVSLGAQSFHPGLLAVLERRAGPDDVRRAFYHLRDAQFDNISLDLIYGIPGQSPSDLARDLAEAIALGPEHLSCYELEAKPGTRFTYAHGVELARQAEAMEGYFEQVVDTLTGAGYRWYETANFCREGFQARHNLAYWLGRDYLGIGIGAVSTVGGLRWRNAPRLRAYLDALAAGTRPPRELEPLDAATRKRERLMLGLRLDEPVPLDAVDGALDGEALGRLRRLGLVERRNGGLVLTRRGRFLGGGVTAELMAEPEVETPAKHRIQGMTDGANQNLTPRQERILVRVVEEHVATGAPVGSKTLVQRTSLGVSSSTVRNDLAVLEELGLLTHPHTSAGRVPTDLGYRFYVDQVLELLEPRPPGELELDLSQARAQVDSALRATTEALAEVTHLLALVSAPPLETTSVRHVEVLLLQPQVVMVVVITSSGGVTKRLFAFDEPVDPGLAEWAREYLNERVAGLQLGMRVLRSRLEDPELSPRERAFLAELRPAFTEALQAGDERLYVGGAAGALDEFGAEELGGYRRLLEVLEQRAALLDLMRVSLASKRPFVRVGSEFEDPELANVSLVGAPYGLQHRNLGAVSLLGPIRMDYVKAIDAVRSAARELSRFVEGFYED